MANIQQINFQTIFQYLEESYEQGPINNGEENTGTSYDYK